MTSRSALLLGLLPAAPLAAQHFHRLPATPRTVAYGWYSAAASPVLHIASGDTLEVETLITNRPDRLEAAGVAPADVQQSLRDIVTQVTDRGPGGHILTGPVYVDGADSGDVLEVRILGIDLAIPYGYNGCAGFLRGNCDSTKTTRIIPLDRDHMVAHFAPGMDIPLHPFFGSMGVAPPRDSGRVSSNPPGIHAGNMDNKELVAGTTLFIPVHAAGALFEVGDGHAAQGDGEVDQTAIETSLRGRLQLIVRKDLHLAWPRAETPTHFITMGMDKDLTRATQIAVQQAIDFVAAYLGWSKMEAYRLVSVACDVRVTELVDGNVGVHVMIPKAIVHPSVGVRVNQMGYLPDARKVAVVCALQPYAIDSFRVVDDRNRAMFGPSPASSGGPFGPCAETFRLDFSALTTPGVYTVEAGAARSLPVRIAADVYRGAADSLLAYLREQQSGYNPVFRDSVHEHSDGILVDHPTRSGEFIPVSGGWADASDYLQYGATTAHATTMLLLSYRDYPAAFTDRHQASGLPGENGIPDVLDEARWGLEWLVRMYPEDDLLLNQLGDDRDHTYWDLPMTDSADYGWGRGGRRPVYPCTGKPQGLFEHKNRSTGLASTAGKYASSFALGAQLLGARDTAFARLLAAKARAAYALGAAHPGVCQTAPARSPYFYEEDDWSDDMELAAATLYDLTREAPYLSAALGYAAIEPVTPWMGQDTARHYQWFPWHNNGHHEIWREGPDSARRLTTDYYRRGLAAVRGRATNGFRVGIPFIWCSNDLLASFATQALFYRRMSGDTTYLEYETAALDWLFGVNPWGVSMVIGLGARFPRSPHSVVSDMLHLQLTGGLVDGPVYRSIFQNLRGIRLLEADEFAPFNTGFIVYHDDVGDYSTNEPIMDGTANLAYVLAALAPSDDIPQPRGRGAP